MIIAERDVIIVGRSDIAVVADVHIFPQALEARNYPVNVFLGRHSRFFRARLYFRAVFVRSREEHHIKTLHSLIAGNRVARDSGIAVTDMSVSRGIINRRGDIKFLLFHGISFLSALLRGNHEYVRKPLRTRCKY